MIYCVVPEELARRTHEMALGLFASGLDPSRATVFVQSQVPEHTELAWIFNTLTPLGELEPHQRHAVGLEQVERVVDKRPIPSLHRREARPAVLVERHHLAVEHG